MDKMHRVTGKYASLDAGVFVAAMTRAARVFQPYDPAFAARCQAAAAKTFRWLEANPNRMHDDPAYADDDSSQEHLWAVAELAADCNAEREAQFVKLAAGHDLGAVVWQSPEMFGYVSLARSNRAGPAARDLARAQVLRAADQLLQKSATSGYGVAMSPGDCRWKSNETLLHRACALVFAFDLTHDVRYRDAALGQLDYLLGENSLAIAFVSGFGQRPVKRSYHWYFAATGRMFPGWPSGGPNGQADGADALLQAYQRLDTPPAKCFLDSERSYACNEGETSETAALAFLAGYFLPGQTTPATDVTATH